MATDLLTINKYSKRVKMGRARVTCWLRAAQDGETLPGGGVVRVDPLGVKWIEAERTTAAAPESIDPIPAGLESPRA